MDPISAIGLTASSIQLADFMFKLVSGTTAIYKSASGASRENDSIEAIARQLQALALEVSSFAVDAQGMVDRNIRESASWCSNTAQQLLDMLEELKREDKTVWRSFRAAVKSMRHGDRVDSLFETLGKMQLTLMTQLQFAMSDKQSKITDTLRQIDETNQKLGLAQVESLIDTRDSIFDAIRDSEARVKATLDNLQPPTAGPEEDVTPRIKTLVNSLFHQKTTSEANQVFLSSLQFDDMRSRQESVKTPHSDTFEWIFKDKTEENLAVNFPTWLKERNGVFWVSGKVGSGKSTLMKFLSLNSHTNEILEEWAGDEELVVGRYYFWSAGSRLQKSREGLMQTLLFELLRACPDAIPSIRWSIAEPPSDSRNWTMSELVAATLYLIAYPTPRKFCLFIDGLDEVDGEPDDLIDLIEKLASLENVKLCCSSRPWTAFGDAFGQDRSYMLRLEDLTAKDIRKYVMDSFQQHKRFKRHARDARFLALVEDIVNRADGVFLWVTLAVKSLRDGLTHADRIADLERRLKAIPSDLEELFRRIIQSVSPSYKQESSELLLLRGCSRCIFPAVFPDILHEIDDNPSVLTHGVGLDLFGDHHDWLDDMARRVDARTKGLIELTRDSAEGPYMPPRLDAERAWRSSLQVLHRTVLDFLRTPKMTEELIKHCRPGFDPYRRMVEASLTLLISPEISIVPNCNDSGPHDLKLRYLVWYVRAMEEEQGISPTDLLDTARKHYPVFTWSPSLVSGLRLTDQKQSFLSLAAERGFNLYISHILRETPAIITQQDKDCFWSPLAMALLFDPGIPTPRPVSHTTVYLLLQHGAEVSRLEGDTGRTAWSLLLESLDPDMKNDRKPVFRDVNEKRLVFAHLISHGADLGDERAKRVIRASFAGRDAVELLGIHQGMAKNGNNAQEVDM